MVHRGKALQEPVKAVSSLDVIEKRADEDPCTSKRRLTRHNFRVAHDN